MCGPTPCHTLWRRKVKDSLEFDQGSTHDSCDGGDKCSNFGKKASRKEANKKT